MGVFLRSLQHEFVVVGDVGVDRVDHLRILVANQRSHHVRVDAGPQLSRDKTVPQVVLAKPLGIFPCFFGKKSLFCLGTYFRRLQGSLAFGCCLSSFGQPSSEGVDVIVGNGGSDSASRHFLTADGRLNAVESHLHGKRRPWPSLVVAKQRTARMQLGESLDDFKAAVGGEVNRSRPAPFGLFAGDDGPLLVEVKMTRLQLLRFLRPTAGIIGDDQEVAERDILDVFQQFLEFLWSDYGRPPFGGSRDSE
jgi:hypothetical protein